MSSSDSSVVRIEQWSLVGSISPVRGTRIVLSAHLHGKVYGHPNFEDGAEVTTSQVLNAE